MIAINAEHAGRRERVTHCRFGELRTSQGKGPDGPFVMFYAADGALSGIVEGGAQGPTARMFGPDKSHVDAGLEPNGCLVVFAMDAEENMVAFFRVPSSLPPHSGKLVIKAGHDEYRLLYSTTKRLAATLEIKDSGPVLTIFGPDGARAVVEAKPNGTLTANVWGADGQNVAYFQTPPPKERTACAAPAQE